MLSCRLVSSSGEAWTMLLLVVETSERPPGLCI
jgi:hypothetical protein